MKTATSLSEECFPFIRSITVLYLILPSFLFAFGWLRWPFGIINIVILAIFAIYLIRDIYQGYGRLKFGSRFQPNHDIHAKSLMFFGLVLLSLIVWLLLSGTGGFGLQNTDYIANNGLLKDLIFQNWPISQTVNGIHGPIVYYFAYYLPAAVIGKIFGWNFANIFLFIWTLIGVVLSFLWFLRITRAEFNQRYVGFFVLLIIFCMAGGLDFFGTKFLQNTAASGTFLNEWWAGYFQYSSNTTLVYWVPQHVIVAWLLTGLIGNVLFDLSSVKYLGIVVSSSIIWSPFGVVGVVPFLLLAVLFSLLSPNRSHIFSRASIVLNVLSIWICVIHLSFIGSNQFKFPIGFIWQTVDDQWRLAVYLALFWFLEFALLGALVILLLLLDFNFSRRTNDQSPQINQKWLNLKNRLAHEYGLLPVQICQFLLSLIVLFCLPLFQLGINNDLVMRASIPSLFMFWAFIGKVIIDASAHIRIRQNLFYVMLYSLILAAVVIGFYPAMRGIKSSVLEYHFGPPALASVGTSADANNPEAVLQRIGSKQSFFYRYFGK